jgi:hypothetical protein
LKKKFEKKFAKKVRKYYKLLEGREGGWRIVIPMPEAINEVDGRRQKFKFLKKTIFRITSGDILMRRYQLLMSSVNQYYWENATIPQHFPTFPQIEKNR